VTDAELLLESRLTELGLTEQTVLLLVAEILSDSEMLVVGPKLQA